MGMVRERGPPRVMPVTVPVAQSPGAINTHITQVTTGSMSNITVESPNKGHFGANSFVPCKEVVPISEVKLKY